MTNRTPQRFPRAQTVGSRHVFNFWAAHTVQHIKKHQAYSIQITSKAWNPLLAESFHVQIEG